MNRTEFLNRLDALLSDISKEEREEAMAYYKSYFEDAGVEYEEDIIRELESPEKVAETIKADLKGATEGMSGKTVYDVAEEDAQYYNAAYENGGFYQEKQNKTTRNILIVLLLVLTSPIWIGVVGTLFGAVVTVVCTVASVAIGLAAVTAALIIVGIVLVGIGIGRWVMGGIATGFALSGAGLLLVALGVLTLILTVLYCGKFLPWAVKGITEICKRAFYAGKEKLA